ncbi:MAG: nucleotide pyrophosphohydrolase [Candidatus Magasanikbacteria bacterium CG_4_10_14_0_2_um_filter_37_12]|uniref:Nucleotide pyrophosphohydrolase n=1 Tax=Candidatus Magasanikbacteria bacterium CG_4_10_14_0_2_um_filter_37_12 TaxID=1974637 RepID=A0A2M7V8M3_9BACT|nr:MAG: nucleotide pyrophosphohydrolase [Candidatus Magasanikbacteria bacterium CG_4_10_14_0_2_um_filter_37_12]
MAISVFIEARELLELFQWIDKDKLEVYTEKNKEKISDEMADMAIYLLEMFRVLDIDMLEAIDNKIQKKAVKYPVEKSKGNNKNDSGL